MPHDLVKYRHILHDDAVYADFVQKCQLRPHVRKLLFKYDRIHGDIDLDRTQMRITHRLRQRLLVKIARIRTRPELLHAQIDRIAAVCDRRPQRLHIPCRSQ